MDGNYLRHLKTQSTVKLRAGPALAAHFFFLDERRKKSMGRVTIRDHANPIIPDTLCHTGVLDANVSTIHPRILNDPPNPQPPSLLSTIASYSLKTFSKKFLTKGP